VEICCPDGSVQNVPYDALVIVTGASYCAPWRGPNECLTQVQREAEVKEIRENIKASKSILCVGAGPTGLETAAFLKESCPEKRVAICQRGDRLLPGFE
jgi:NADPH-dependent 2,4-dienoyl-CoA reductase/sulfur reductase-like enzyme